MQKHTRIMRSLSLSHSQYKLQSCSVECHKNNVFQYKIPSIVKLAHILSVKGHAPCLTQPQHPSWHSTHALLFSSLSLTIVIISFFSFFWLFQVMWWYVINGWIHAARADGHLHIHVSTLLGHGAIKMAWILFLSFFKMSYAACAAYFLAHVNHGKEKVWWSKGLLLCEWRYIGGSG